MIDIVGDSSKIKNTTEVASGSATKMGALIGLTAPSQWASNAVIYFGGEAIALGRVLSRD